MDLNITNEIVALKRFSFYQIRQNCELRDRYLVKRTLPELRRSIAVATYAVRMSKHPPSRPADTLKIRDADRRLPVTFAVFSADDSSSSGKQAAESDPPTTVAASEQHSEITGEYCPQLLS